MCLDGKEARVVMQQTATGLDQVKRSSSPNRVDTRYAGSTSTQGINYDRIFVDGSPHQIHPRTITLRAALITREPQLGSRKEAYIVNGNQHLRFSGSMENVRCCPTPYQTLPDGLSCVAGSGKSILWFVDPLLLLSKLTEVVFHSPVLQLSKISK